MTRHSTDLAAVTPRRTPRTRRTPRAEDLELGRIGDGDAEVVERKFTDASENSRASECSIDAKVPLYRDPCNLGLVLHFWTSGFVTNGCTAAIQGVFAGYLNVPSYIVNGSLSLTAVPAIFSAVLGALSDLKPILGFHRRPYMCLGWTIIFVSLSLLVCIGLPEPYYCYEADGAYLLHDAPCNPSAQHQYAPLMCCFLVLSTGLIVAGAAADGLLVQMAKAESEDRRGETQALLLTIQNCGRFCATAVAAFGFNGKMFTGSFDQRSQLGFSQYAAIFLGPAALTAVSCIFMVEEPKAQKGSMRSFWSSSFHLMEGRAFAAIATYLFLSSSIFSISSNAGQWVSLQWAGVKMIQSQLAGLVGLLFVAFGTWLTQKYFLNVSWRKILLFGTLSMLALNATPQFLTIFDIIRDPYFYLGEPIVKEVPVGMMALVTTLIANEVADESNCALVIGMLKSIGAIAGPFSVLLSNQIFAIFQPSLTERQNFIEDQVSFRWTVAKSYLLSYAFCLIGLAFLRLLPSQKADAQRRKREWPTCPHYAYLGCTVLVLSFLYTLVGDVLILDERLACMRFLGGKGCES